MKSLLFATILVTAVPAMAQNASTPTAATVADATSSKPQKVCRTAEQATGSIMAPKRVCHSREEWAAIETAAAKARGPSAPAPSQVVLDPLVSH